MQPTTEVTVTTSFFVMLSAVLGSVLTTPFWTWTTLTVYMV